jgi:hypothetical protein
VAYIALQEVFYRHFMSHLEQRVHVVERRH